MMPADLVKRVVEACRWGPEPGVRAHGKGQRKLLRQPVPPPDAGAAEEARRYERGHAPVAQVGVAEAAGHKVPRMA
jgi:hypothetical protein